MTSPRMVVQVTRPVVQVTKELFIFVDLGGVKCEGKDLQE